VYREEGRELRICGSKVNSKRKIPEPTRL